MNNPLFLGENLSEKVIHYTSTHSMTSSRNCLAPYKARVWCKAFLKVGARHWLKLTCPVGTKIPWLYQHSP